MNPSTHHLPQVTQTPTPSRPAGGRPLPRARLVDSLAPGSALRTYWLERLPETASRYQLRGVTGVIFMLFGFMKALAMPTLVGAPGLHVASGAEGFARLLSGLGVPFPLFNAWFVIVLEVVAGLGLILGAWTPATRLITRLCALPLAGDMMVALLVGIRQVTGNPVVMDGFPVMNQFWRLPLELGLGLSMAYLLWRPAPRRVVTRPVPVPVPVEE
ncbi:DoxX family protein [Archangium sp.]|uniref:DoxX family protein n=1 Tax=Archangium sp. TaxID=1872627 RepID=UPI003899A2C3